MEANERDRALDRFIASHGGGDGSIRREDVPALKAGAVDVLELLSDMARHTRAEIEAHLHPALEAMRRMRDLRVTLRPLGWTVARARRQGRVFESGPRARPCDVDWVRSIKRQCGASTVPVFVKQLGAHVIDHGATAIAETFPPEECWPDGVCERMNAGPPEARIRLEDPKGGDPSEWPEDLRVREFPLSPSGREEENE